MEAIAYKFRAEQHIPQSRKNERAVLNMPRNTLLDPQNVIATWGGDEEKVREESVQLKALK